MINWDLGWLPLHATHTCHSIHYYSLGPSFHWSSKTQIMMSPNTGLTKYSSVYWFEINKLKQQQYMATYNILTHIWQILWHVFCCWLIVSNYCIFVATLDGSLGYLLPLQEKVYRRLLMLQNALNIQIPHIAGLNPKAYR